MQHFAKTLLVYWSLGIFFPMGDFSQLATLPGLVRHYQLHRAESESPVSLLIFWGQHYAGNPDHQHAGAPSDHQQLPFKTFQDSHWVDARRPLACPLSVPSFGTLISSFFTVPLSDGIRTGVSRPPLAA